jgi:hypothetical protein
VTISRLGVIYSAENGFLLQQAEKQCNEMPEAQIHTHISMHLLNKQFVLFGRIHKIEKSNY